MTQQVLQGYFVEAPQLPAKNSNSIGGSSPTMDVTGEKLHCVGHIMLESPGGNKTISSAGGKIHWCSGAVTFVDAGTTVRIGIQDVSTASSPGHGDGTFDVYDDLIGGTDTISANALQATTMSSGTKTISHGQLIAVVFDMQSRGGTDSVKVTNLIPQDSATTSPLFPCANLETSGPTFTRNGVPNVIIEFDDGTLGYFLDTIPPCTQSTQAFNNGTGTADEYGNLIQFAHDVVAVGICLPIQPASASADFELILYSDPLGTPAVIETVTVDATQLGATTAGFCKVAFSTPRTLTKNTAYGVTCRPTTANNVTLGYYSVAAANHWKADSLDGNTYAIRRLDNTGAFSDFNGGVANTRRMFIGLAIGKFDDGSGSGSVGPQILRPNRSFGNRM